MNNITEKFSSLRTAKAQSIMTMPADVLILLRDKQLKKGDALEIGRAAGILAAKRTADLLPLCHPLPLQGTEILYEFISATQLKITAEVCLIGHTGVEMEALTAVSITALSIYDLLKPHAGMNLLITDTLLLEKTGGKSDFPRKLTHPKEAVILIVSDALISGKKQRHAGNVISQILEKSGFVVRAQEILPEDKHNLFARLAEYTQQKMPLIITLGGTGAQRHDATSEWLNSLFDKPLPSFAQTALSHGLARTPYATMSQITAGWITQSVVLGLPGNRMGASDSLTALIPSLIKLF